MNEIRMWGVKQNNLKNIDVDIPLGKMTVVCGPSGSGKSSLAFETLFAEGQRRFIESMSHYTRQFLNKAPKPNLEGIENIPPAISIEQKNSVKNSRSTVGTTTELIDYLRLLYEKLGQTYCPDHHLKTIKYTLANAAEEVLRVFSAKRGYLLSEIKLEKKQDLKKLYEFLLKEGYSRVYIPTENIKKPAGAQKPPSADTEIFELSDLLKKKKNSTAQLFLVIDRLSFSADEKGRLTDSLRQAYEASIKFNRYQLVRSAQVVTSEGEWFFLSEESTCPQCDFVAPNLSARLFSFNSPLGACPTCKGFGNLLVLDEKKIVPNPELSLSEGALSPFTMPSAEHEKKQLEKFCKAQKISMQVPWKNLSDEHRQVLWKGSPQFMGVEGLFEYLEQIKYKMHVRVFISRFRSPQVCPICHGSRLKKESLSVLIDNKNIHDLCVLPLSEFMDYFESKKWNPYEKELASDIIHQVSSRLEYLNRVGVGYITLARETRTLSGGEFQRIMLSKQLGMGLSQTLYVLDEPTVGLHPRDNDRLISILKDIRDLGNTLVIVEHDHDVIAQSENILELGPGSGYLGGEIIFHGSPKEFQTSKKSLTSKYLHPTLKAGRPHRPIDMKSYKYKIKITGATGNNLKNVDLEIPLNRLVTVTGVSGSGKSTLISKTLYPALARALDIEFLPNAAMDSLEGSEFLKNVILIDQSSIGRTARSSPVTFMKTFDAIRTLMAGLPEAKAAKYTPGTFSLNVDGGRCPTCRGTGYEEIDMQFMDNVIIPCDVCDGKKFRPEILEIRFEGKNISEILRMTVGEAMPFFRSFPSIYKSLSYLKEVGLEYLQLGQPAVTLSGGESQRLKIAKELSQAQQKACLYILDEPTTGLHFKEIEILMRVLNKLVDNGGSVVVVEHNQDVIRESDYIIDLGPDGGKFGGEIVFRGTPEELVRDSKNLTGHYLKRYLSGASI